MYMYSLCLQLAQVPRSADLAIFVPTTTTMTTWLITLPLAHVRGVIIGNLPHPPSRVYFRGEPARMCFRLHPPPSNWLSLLFYMGLPPPGFVFPPLEIFHYVFAPSWAKSWNKPCSLTNWSWKNSKHSLVPSPLRRERKGSGQTCIEPVSPVQPRVRANQIRVLQSHDVKNGN